MKIMFSIVKLARGGAENVSSILANYFSEHGHEVYFVNNHTREELDNFYPLNEKIQVINAFPKKGFINKLVSLRKIVKKIKPDFILGITAYPSFFSLLASIGLKTIVISTDHDSFELPPNAKPAFVPSFFKHQVNRIYRCVTVITNADAQIVENRFRKTVVMPNPLAITPAANVPDNKRKKILAVGRLDAWHVKGFDLLIKAWVKIYEKHPDWELEIAGEGDSGKKYLSELASQIGLKSQFSLSGFHLNVKQLYENSEIFVLSSRYEGFGMALIEAMSQGCACIACDYKGRQREIIKNSDQGICIAVEDENIIATSIEKLINDSEYRKRIQHNAIDRSKDFVPDIIGRKWLELFNSLRGNDE